MIFVKRYQTCFYFQVQEWSFIYRCKGIHVLAYFEPCHPTRKFDINDDNLIYGHHQDYYRKSYFIRNAELWNLLLSSMKTIHYFSSVKTSLNNIYLSKRETHNPPGCYWYMFLVQLPGWLQRSQILKWLPYILLMSCYKGQMGKEKIKLLRVGKMLINLAWHYPKERYEAFADGVKWIC